MVQDGPSQLQANQGGSPRHLISLTLSRGFTLVFLRVGSGSSSIPPQQIDLDPFLLPAPFRGTFLNEIQSDKEDSRLTEALDLYLMKFHCIFVHDRQEILFHSSVRAR